VHWSVVLASTIVPHFRVNESYFALLIAVLGTTISPYLFFWQSAHRLEELREAAEGGDRAVSLKERSHRDAQAKKVSSRMDVFTGMGFSNLVMWAIILVTAQSLATHGHHDIQSAAQAAAALKPVAGRFASILFALGFIGTGMLAIPVLAGAGAVGMAGLLHKKWGFSRSVREAPVFYGLVALGTLGGTALSVLHVNPIKLLVIVAMVNGLAAAPFLVLVMLISPDRKLMGQHRNGKLASALGWLTVGLMASAAVALFLTRGR
jgi:Mn2+/Fe2+ NRAMP family transporter